jgi:hypothetical protein
MPHQCLHRSSFSWCASACSASPAVRPIAAIVTPLPVRPWGAGRCKWTATEPAVTETPKSGTTAVRSKATPQDVVAETSTPDANALLEQLAASVGVWCKLSLADGRHGRYEYDILKKDDGATDECWNGSRVPLASSHSTPVININNRCYQYNLVTIVLLLTAAAFLYPPEACSRGARRLAPSRRERPPPRTALYT